MRWIRAVILAFSTYTYIPMPQVKWDDEAVKSAIAFLPLAGALLGVAVWGWAAVCGILGLSPVLFAAGAVGLPVAITGGIHMDGYCDTVDALASWQSRERKLEILKDPHVGAFALIRFAVYVLVCFGLFYELYLRDAVYGIGFLYPLSRVFAAWSAMFMPNARKEGMLATFTEGADRIKACAILAFFTVLAPAGWIFFTFPYGIYGLAFCLPVAIWYVRLAMKHFGGATGDTTGFFLQILELALPAGLLFGRIIGEWM